MLTIRSIVDPVRLCSHDSRKLSCLFERFQVEESLSSKFEHTAELEMLINICDYPNLSSIMNFLIFDH